MIGPRDQLAIRRIPLSLITVSEHQPRYWRRVRHFVRLMRAHPDDAPGLLVVAVAGERYELQDGHHRFCAAIICGREEMLCVVVKETGA